MLQHRKKKFIFMTLLFCSVMTISSGCLKTARITINASSPLILEISTILEGYDDLEMAEKGLPGQILLLEGLIGQYPDNPEFRLAAARAYYAYADTFILESDPQRAGELFLKARTHGMESLLENKKFRKHPRNSLPDLTEALKFLDRKYIDSLFWTAAAWASWIDINRKEPDAVYEIAFANAMMDRVLLIDESYYHGAALSYFAAYYAGIPAAAGGGIEKAKRYFDRAFNINQRKFLMTQYLMAAEYAVPLKDENLFDRLAAEILNTPAEALPDAVFVNLSAKRKIRRLIELKNSLF